MSATHQHHPTPHDHRPGHAHPDHGADHHQAQVLDLDSEVLAEHIAAITAWLPVQVAPREILDLGAGTGAGTFALLSQFPHAHVTAVDASSAHLDQLRGKAFAADLGDRVRIVHADLDAAEWPDFGTPDLVWASASMHHLADPDRALRTIRDALAPGGLVAVLELSGLPRFLPPDAPGSGPGLEERCHAATQPRLAEHMPHRGADWGPKLTAAGLTVEASRTIDMQVEASRDNAVAAYALAALQGIRTASAEVLTAVDLAALDQLLDPDSPRSILRRDDLALRTSRTVWAARRTRA